MCIHPTMREVNKTETEKTTKDRENKMLKTSNKNNKFSSSKTIN